MESHALDLVLQQGSKELLLRSLEEGISDSENRVLFFDGVHHFPFVLREIEPGASEGMYILSGVADTLKRGRHRAQIEFLIAEGKGRFL